MTDTTPYSTGQATGTTQDTDTTQDTVSRDPAAIEQDIRRTQDDMSRTVQRIGDQLNPRRLLDQLLDGADGQGIDARRMLDAARRNPPAAAMVALGSVWLLSGKEAHMPQMPSFGGGRGASDRSRDQDAEHRDYLAHMSQCEPREGEDPLAYQRRRDLARANYFMVERGHEEDESSFRKRLDEATEGFRQRRRAFAEGARHRGQALADSARHQREAMTSSAGHMAERGAQYYEQNPLVGGLVAAAAGAFVGSLLPLSRTEEERLASLGEKAREAAGEQKDRLASQLRERKDELVDKAEQKLGDAGQGKDQSQSGGTGMGGAGSTTEGSGQSAGGGSVGSTQGAGTPQYQVPPLPVT